MKEKKNKKNFIELKKIIKWLIKLLGYLTLSLILLFLLLYVGSHFWLESLKIDTSEVVSDMLEDLPQKTHHHY